MRRSRGAHGYVRRSLRWLQLGLGTASLIAVAEASRAAEPAPSTMHGAAAAIDGNATDFFSKARLARLPPGKRAVWARYLARSAQVSAADHAAMAAELRALGKAEMTPAPYAKGFHVEASMSDAWFAGPDARRVAECVLSFQTPAGGWSKRVDMTLRPRLAGESYYSENERWDYIATIDNDSTTQQLRFLAGLQRAQPDSRYERALRKGIAYLLQAQFPNGCWPQVYPLRGGYHDAATFNDDATVNVLRLLHDALQGKFLLSSTAQRQLVPTALGRGLECIVAAQVMVAGKRTIWAQQHDPLDLSPVPARSYELVGLAGRESAGITQLLMEQAAPSPSVVLAVHAAVEWFRAHQIWGYEYDFNAGLRRVEGAGPIWARLSEIETGYSIFSNREGIKLYDWNKLTDRRQGYAWYGSEPARVLAAYDAWAAKHEKRASD
jgi:PelA/Pel-15E family pectate lyase